MTLEVLTFPTSIYPSSQRLVPDVGEGQQLHESPFVGAQSVTTFRGAERWRLELGFEGLTGADRAEMMAFVTRLRVSHNVFLCPNHSAPQRGSAVNSSANAHAINEDVSGGSSYVKIWWQGALSDPTGTSPLKAGDFFSVNSELKMLLRDAAPADVADVSSVHFWPPLFSSVTSGTPVYANVSSAYGGFRLLRATEFSTRPPGYISDFTISAVERINSGAVADFL